MKKTIYTTVLFLLSLQLLVAQNNAQAEKIVTDLLNDAKTSAIKTNFSMVGKDKSNGNIAVSGTFTLKGSKFVLEMDKVKIWFNGKTQWSYAVQNNEVSITEPSDKELAEINPMAILSGFKAKCIIKFSATAKSAQNYCIEMTPKAAEKNIAKIDVQVNKNNGNLVSIQLTTKTGSTSLLTLSRFQKGVKVADNIFTFNQGKYKGVTVNDLR